MFRKIHIRKHEVGLLFKRGDFVRPLGAGTYRLPFWTHHRKIEVIDMLRTRFDHALLDMLTRFGSPRIKGRHLTQIIAGAGVGE